RLCGRFRYAASPATFPAVKCASTVATMRGPSGRSGKRSSSRVTSQ
ncbi:hypothetical protein BMAJHU_F0260, partial [Burkholderia mallei JHU]